MPQSGWTPVAESKGWTLVEPAKADAPAPTEPERTWGDTALDVGKGILKGVGGTVAGIGEMAGNAGLIPGQAGRLGRNPLFDRTDELTKATNTPQMVGKGLETAAEIALPVLKGASAIPRTARAGAALQDVMAAAKSVPLDLAAPGNSALRIQQLAGRGGTEPRMVRQFVARVTDPSKAPMNFEEGRDFYSNLSRLSGDEFNRLTGPIKREVGNLRTALNDSLKGAADTVGKGEKYAKGMDEYRRAAKLNDQVGDIGSAAKRALPLGLGGGALGAGGYAAKKLFDLLLGSQ